MTRVKKTRMSGARDLPADADVDFVLHTPGRDYDLVEIFDFDEDEDEAVEVLDVDEISDDIDEDADTGIWDIPTLRREAAANEEPTNPLAPAIRPETPWWEAAKRGIRAKSSYQELPRRELAWWEAARMGLRAPTED